MFDARNAIGTLWPRAWQDRLRMLIGVAYMRMTHAAVATWTTVHTTRESRLACAHKTRGCASSSPTLSMTSSPPRLWS